MTTTISPQSYIVTQAGIVYEMAFDDKVSTFTCGPFSVGGQARKAFVYVNFQGKIRIFTDICLEGGAFPVLDVKSAADPLASLLSSRGISVPLPGKEEWEKLNAYLLYGTRRE